MKRDKPCCPADSAVFWIEGGKAINKESLWRDVSLEWYHNMEDKECPQGLSQGSSLGDCCMAGQHCLSQRSAVGSQIQCTAGQQNDVCSVWHFYATWRWPQPMHFMYRVAACIIVQRQPPFLYGLPYYASPYEGTPPPLFWHQACGCPTE